MAKFCKRRGIEQKFTPPYTPQLNGVAERMNRTLVECARCMIEHAGLPKAYWGEAVMTSAFLRNRCPTRGIVMDKSPYQVWTGRKPVLANLKVFGCHAYVTVNKEKRKKNWTLGRYAVGFSATQSMRKRIVVKKLRMVVCLLAVTQSFMEDTFDCGSRDRPHNDVVIQDNDETTDQDSS